jgi:3-hydroxyisobutyrate dehydrogenase
MGAPMARNLARAGHEVTVWNRTREKAEAVEGARVADTPADAVRDAEIVLTMLRDAAAVEQTLSGVARLPLWIQSSTVGIDDTERLARRAHALDAAFVDAPVVGSKDRAQRAGLTVLAAGPDDERERADAVFSAYGEKTIWLGDPPAATRMKLTLNALLLGVIGSLAETLAFARTIGLEAQAVLDAVAGGPMASQAIEARGGSMAREDFRPGFPVELARKDAQLVLDAAEGATLRILRAAAEQYERAAELGHGDDDMAAVLYAALPSGA